MVRLSREIVVYMAGGARPRDVLGRLSDPFWFQSFGCVLGFDWHSSGVTTTVCGAVKEALAEGRRGDRALRRGRKGRGLSPDAGADRGGLRAAGP
jgi:hypothetical protein